MEPLRKIFAILVLVFLTITATCALFGWAVARAAANPANYKKVIQQPQIFLWSQSSINQQMVKFIRDKNHSANLLNKVPEADWRSVTESLLPDEWIGTVDESLVHFILNWLQDDAYTLPPDPIDLRPIKDNLRSQKGVDGILQLAQILPTCAQGSDAQQTSSWLTDSNCIPPTINLVLVAPLLADTIADQLPDQVSARDLMQTVIFSGEGGLFLNKVHVAYQVVVAGLQLLVRLSLLFFSLYGLLQSASVRRLIRAARFPFYITGIVSLIILAILHLFLDPILTWVLRFVFPQLPVDLNSIILELADLADKAIENIWLWWAGGLLAVGGLFHLANSLLVSKANRRLAQAQQARVPHRVIRKQFR